MSNESEEHGMAEVTFGPLRRALREHRYPVTDAELVEQYGGFELEFGGDSEPLESVLRRCEQSTFTEPRQVRDAVVDVVGDETAVRLGGDGGEWSRLSDG